MVELSEMTPCHGLLPLSMGGVTVEEVAVGALTSLCAFGDASTLSTALEKAHGVRLPEPGKSTTQGDVRCIWFRRDEALLMGAAPEAALSQHGAVVDQSDAWAVVDLQGAGAVDVLARLVPMDLRDAAFALGDTARTQIVHISASITKLDTNCFRLMVFRSMAGTLVHDLTRAMAAVASRG